jgi:hypothetical protein
MPEEWFWKDEESREDGLFWFIMNKTIDWNEESIIIQETVTCQHVEGCYANGITYMCAHYDTSTQYVYAEYKCVYDIVLLCEKNGVDIPECIVNDINRLECQE